MTVKKFEDLLYPLSPFLAPTNGLVENVEYILGLMKKTKILPLHGVCHELCNIADTLNFIQIQEYAWLKKSFSCNIDDLDWFFLGYTTAPTIIISACSMEIISRKKVIENLTVPINSKKMTELNQYKVKFLLNAFAITTNHLTSKPSLVFDPIYNVLNNSPFNSHRYYLAGVESSRLTAIELSKMLELRLTPIQ